MTAIALLNIYKEPHLISDSMLSQHKNQIPSERKIWVPARGYIDSVQQDGPEGWRISAFARKTIYLPNGAGLFAWSGILPHAHIFWKFLSEKFLSLSGYDPAAKLCYADLEKVFYDTKIEITREHGNLQLHIVGYCCDGNDVTPFAFNKYKELCTKNYGICWIIGSGRDCIETAIKLKDEYADLVETQSHSTRQLAQYISSRMLFIDSLKMGYRPDELPVNQYSGGYFEWHSVKGSGISFSPAHLDFNVRYDCERALITRIYFSEILYRNDTAGRPLPLRYVLTLTDKDIEVTSIQNKNGRMTLNVPSASGVILHQSLDLESDFVNSDGSRDISGPLGAREFSVLYKSPIYIKSVRTFFIINGHRPEIRTYGFEIPEGKECQSPASLLFEGGMLKLEFDGALVAVAK